MNSGTTKLNIDKHSLCNSQFSDWRYCFSVVSKHRIVIVIKRYRISHIVKFASFVLSFSESPIVAFSLFMLPYSCKKIFKYNTKQPHLSNQMRIKKYHCILTLQFFHKLFNHTKYGCLGSFPESIYTSYFVYNT